MYAYHTYTLRVYDGDRRFSLTKLVQTNSVCILSNMLPLQRYCMDGSSLEARGSHSSQRKSKLATDTRLTGLLTDTVVQDVPTEERGRRLSRYRTTPGQKDAKKRFGYHSIRAARLYPPSLDLPFFFPRLDLRSFFRTLSSLGKLQCKRLSYQTCLFFFFL